MSPSPQTERRHASRRGQDVIWLDASEAYHLITHNLVDYAIFTMDLEGQITTWNKGAEITLGYLPEEALGRSASILFTPEDQAAGIFEKETRTAAERGRAEDNRWHLRKDGRRIWVHGALAALKTDSGELRGFCKFMHDVTAQKEAQETLQHQAKNLLESNRELDHFAAIVSHDLQAPIHSIHDYLAHMEGRLGDRPDPEIKNDLDNTKAALQRMSDMVSGILGYSRSGRMDIVLEEVPMEDVVKNLMVDMHSLIQTKKAQITYTPLPVIRANELLIYQLMLNLFSNAIKFTGSKPPTVHISAAGKGAMWQFCVRDNGIGILPEQQEKIFEMFHRSPRADEVVGSGIGLATCRRIIQRHGGRIWVESTPDQGATFCFTLPK